MNLLLMIAGYPPAVIRKRDRLAYISALEKAQLGGSKDTYEKIIAMGDVDTDDLLKIGELAKEAGETIPTIRYWTKEGLLEVAEVTQSGYQLYAADMAARCKQIKKLKGERLTLKEIKQQL